MARKLNTIGIPNDYVRFYPMDGDGIDSAGNGDASITDGTFTSAEYSYTAEQLDWGANTSFTYSSATYTNSYLIKDGQLLKNSDEVTDTALNGTDGSSYGGLFLFNRTLNDEEELEIKDYMNRIKGPTNLLPSPNTKVRDGLVGEWNLDNNALDTSGNGNNGTPTDVVYNPVWGGGVGGFNGSSSYIDTGYKDFGTGSFTLLVWLKSGGSQKGTRLFGLYNGGDSPSNIAITFGQGTNSDNDKLSFWIRDSDGVKTTQDNTADSIVLTDGKWHYGVLVVNRDDNTVKMYTDGILTNDVSKDFTGTFSPDNRNIIIGTTTDSDGNAESSHMFNGNIGLTRIYNRALSQQEINQLYQEGLKYINGNKYSLPSLEQDKVLEISKPQDANNKYYDQSGNGQTGDATDVVDSTVGLNNVMSFNGSSSIIETTLTDNYQNKTLYFTFNCNNNDNYSIIFGKQLDSSGTADDDDFNIGFRDNGTLSVMTKNTEIIVSPVLELNKYYIVSVVFDAGDVSLYINNELIGTGTETYINSDTPYTIGGIKKDSDSSTIKVFTGQIINPRIYNRALSPEEIQQDYYSNYIN